MNSIIFALTLPAGYEAFLIPGLALLIVLAFIVTIYQVASRYKKFSPNEVGIFYGRKYKGLDGHEVGFRVVSGGGALQLPIVESLQVMSTAVFQFAIDETGIPNKDNVRVEVKGVATCKISTAAEDLRSAAAAFLGKEPDAIESMVKNILTGHLRSIIGKMTIDEILRNRDTFNKNIVTESAEEIKRLGVQVITIVIQDVNDVHGYIDALGQQAVAEAVRDAEIKVAEARAETQKKISTANMDASIVAAKNAIQVAEAEKNRDVKTAQFKTDVAAEQAKASKALEIETATQEQTLLKKQAERDAASNEAQIKVSEQEALRAAAELVATVIKPAETAKQKAVIDAEAAKQKAIIEAESSKQTKTLNAQAAKEVAILEADATKQTAVKRAEGERDAAVLVGEGIKARLTGEADGNKAMLFAEAEGEARKIEQKLMAEAKGHAAMKGDVLKAEAEGTKQLAEALREMNDAARLIIILDKLPNLLDHGGDAAARMLKEVFTPFAAGLHAIDSVHIVDMGGNGNGVNRMANTVPEMMFALLAKCQASGIDLQGMAGKLGIDISKLMALIGQTPKSESAPVTVPLEHHIEVNK
ncbi:MAG: SPFH domain-containing protein [Planctomycetota bacterium]